MAPLLLGLVLFFALGLQRLSALANAPDAGAHWAPGSTLSTRVPPGLRAYSVDLDRARDLKLGDFIDLLFLVDVGEPVVVTLLQRAEVVGLGEPTEQERPVTLAVLPGEAQALALASGLGVLRATLRNPEDLDIQEERSRLTPQAVLTGERLYALNRHRYHRSCGVMRIRSK